jgi:hypothetical protein
MSFVTTGRTCTRHGAGSFTFAPCIGNSSFNNTCRNEIQVYTTVNVSPFNSLPLIDISAVSIWASTPQITGSVSFCGSASSATVNYSGTASWAYTFDCEELVSFSPASGAFPGENGIPNFLTLFTLGPKIGGSYSVTITIGSNTITTSGTITSTMSEYIIRNLPYWDIGVGFNANLTTDCVYNSGIFESSIVAGITGSIDNNNLGWNYVYNQGSTGTNVIVDYTSGIKCTVTNVSSYTGEQTLNQTFNTNYQISGKISTITGNETNTLHALVFALNYPPLPPFFIPQSVPIGNYIFNPSANANFNIGSGAIGYAQPYNYFQVQAFYAPSPVGFTTLLDINDPTTAIECALTQPPNTSSTNYSDVRLLSRFPIVSAGPVLSQSTRIQLDPCNSLTSPGTWTNATIVSGHIQVDSSIHTTSKVTYSSPIISRQGRYLAFKIQAVTTNTPITIAVQMVKGTVNYATVSGTGGSPQDIIIDLCCCPGYPGPDYQNSKYYEPISIYPEGPTWGANTISSIQFTFPASSGVYSIQQIAITTVEPPIISTQIAMEACEDPSTTITYFMSTIVDVDGRRALEQPSCTAVTPQTFYTVSNFISALDNGWTCTWTNPNVWYLPNPYICYLGGAGSTYMKGTVQNYIRNQWGQTSPIPMQMMTDQVLGYPGMGDVMGGGGIDGTSFISYIYKILRGTFNGIVCNSTPTPISGATVTSSIGTTVTGTGTTDVEGIFRLGSPGSIGYGSDPSTSGNSIIVGSTTLHSPIAIRQDRRIGIKGSTSISLPYIVEDKLGRLHQAVIDNGDVLYQVSDFSENIQNGWRSSNIITSFGDVISAEMSIDPQIQRIWLTYVRLTSSVYNTYLCYSDNDGSSFGGNILIMSNSLGSSVSISDDSVMIVSWFQYNSGSSGNGVMKGQVSLGSGQSLGSVFTFSDSTNTAISIADKGWSNVAWAKSNAKELVWSPILAGGTTPTVKISYDNGNTWA